MMCVPDSWIMPGLLFLVIALFVGVIISSGWPRWVEWDCDLCGRHTRCKEWQSSKAASGHVCDECIQSEKDAEQRWQ